LRATPAQAPQKPFPEEAGRWSDVRPIGFRLGLLHGRYVHGFNYYHESAIWIEEPAVLSYRPRG
jgi:hypothetical protein